GSGNVYVAGKAGATWGSPVNAFAASYDAFAAKLNSSGVYQWHTFMGGANDDEGKSVAVDGSGNVYVAGWSNATWGSPIDAYTGSNGAFAAKLNSSGVRQSHTFIGGTGSDYCYAVAVDGSGNVYTAGYSDVTWGSPVNAYTSQDIFAAKLLLIASEPLTQASSVNFTSVTTVSGTVNWTDGDGTYRIVLVKSGSAVDSDPVDGTTYTANAAFGSGTQIGTGNYVVYSGTGSSVPVTGLTLGTAYYAAVYEFNGSGGTQNYLVPAAAGNFTTRYVPVIAQGASVPVSMDEDGAPLAWSPPTVTATDGDADTITWSVSSTASDGTATVSGTGVSPPTFTYAPDADFNGSDSFDVQASDADGSDTITVNVTINAVNDAPSFTKGADQTVSEDAGAQTVNGWATSISKGPADESAQVLTFNVSNDNNSLFSAQPDLNTSGDLTYTPAADANGSTTVTVSLSDNGGGTDTSGNQTFTITVSAVNDTPSFTKGADQTVFEDPGAQTVSGWATSISKGPANESGQALTFNVSNDNNALFSVQPAADASGDLTYTPAADANGTTTVTVSLSDDGGGADTSGNQTFTITVNPVNDAPAFSASSPSAVNEDAGAQTVTSWAAFDAGPADEDGPQSVVAYAVSNVSNTGLFSAGPAVDISGNLTYTPASDINGTSTFDVTVQDSGGTADSGVDTSAVQNFTITVNSVNDTPSFAKGADQTVSEDSGAQTANGWATSISKGPADESAQILTFSVSND
ncbi:MAG: tandem-95 repeat protein, partial [Mycoplasma sp.]|nr:tandem-95 repeat protein [Mycoplasma sp.]